MFGLYRHTWYNFLCNSRPTYDMSSLKDFTDIPGTISSVTAAPPMTCRLSSTLQTHLVQFPL